jgi:hypothetical protein
MGIQSASMSALGSLSVKTTVWSSLASTVRIPVVSDAYGDTWCSITQS